MMKYNWCLRRSLYGIIIFLILTVPGAYSQKFPLVPDHEDWADSVLATMTLDEKIGQLFMVAAYSNRDTAHENEILGLVRDYHVGGLIFFQGGPVRQSRLLNKYQRSAEIPLWIGMDAEWGVGMRLDSAIRFPYQMTLGAIQDNRLIYKMGREIAREFHRLGMHVNFAPVADINNNAQNPVINFRSFGEDRENVTEKALAYMKGLQDQNIIASAKHFPGHGDTNVDSHSDLPVIHHSYSHLDSIELYPFKKLFREGIGSVMIAHLDVPWLDPAPNMPTTLSGPVVSGLLRDSLHFNGLVFTDALNMQGVAKYYQPGEVELKALLAGNDVLLFPRDVPKSIAMIKSAVVNNQVSVSYINERVRKILVAKSWTGARDTRDVELGNLYEDLNNSQALMLRRELAEASLTVIKNNSILPLRPLDSLQIASVSIGQETPDILQERLSDYTTVDHFLVKSGEDMNLFCEKLKNYNLVILNMRGLSRNAANQYGITGEMAGQAREIIAACPVVLAWFGIPYGLTVIPEFANAHAVIVAYQDSPETSDLVPQLIFGGIGATGKLPVSINDSFPAGTGIPVPSISRLSYGMPEEVGLDSKYLSSGIDSIAEYALINQVAPGLQVLVARNGKVVLHKTYGYHTYDSVQLVAKDDLYDFASVTKITTSLPAIMKMHDERKLDLEDRLGDILPEFSHGNKKDLTFRRMMTHTAGLQSWIAFWTTTLKKNGKYKSRTLSPDSSANYPIRLTDHLYEYKSYKDKIYKMIRKSPLKPEQGYVYSDLSFIIYPKVVERLTGQPWETFLKKTFYHPLGANTLTYNPMKYFDLNQIIPTENDTFFRKVQLHGVVHDEGAAMLQGISGHAGLFGSTNDLAKLMQMYLNGGSFGGAQYISGATMKKFEICQYCNEGVRRAIGFDRPIPGHPYDGTCAKDASDSSFGHSGYTGTYTWVDPETGILFIFFCNRVFPTRLNVKISDLNIRPAMHQVIYDSRIMK
jgi:beta-glucosidase-like glycosyl hydrolase/CubicO group peptidase (beta-lactamase class C family)